MAVLEELDAPAEVPVERSLLGRPGVMMLGLGVETLGTPTLGVERLGTVTLGVDMLGAPTLGVETLGAPTRTWAMARDEVPTKRAAAMRVPYRMGGSAP